MQVWLQVSAGQTIGQKFHLRRGQVARFGQSDWADFSFPDDTAMDQVQFEVAVDDRGPRLRHLGKQIQTLLNGEAVEGQALLQGGNTVAAGRTSFTVYIEGQVASQSSEAEESAAAPANPLDIANDMRGVARYLKLDDEPFALAQQQQTPRELIDQLKEAGEFPAAARVQAHYLPRVVAVQWGIACFKQVADDTCPPELTAALEAADRWCQQSTEENRLAAGRAAEAAMYDGPPAMLALAAFCSEGNIGHPDHQPVLADERITGESVATSILQSAYWNEALKSKERFDAFLTHEILTPAEV